MKPSDIAWREILNDPSWDEKELRNLISICEEKIRQLQRTREGRLAKLWRGDHGK